jgi:hypothetical protein
LLDRSLVDRMVYAPGRMVFEGPPILEPPLAQDQASRTPDVIDGPSVDTRTVSPNLGLVEQAKLRDLRAAETRRLASDTKTASSRYVLHVAERTRCTKDEAQHRVEQQSRGVLLPAVVLPFD